MHVTICLLFLATCQGDMVSAELRPFPMVKAAKIHNCTARRIAFHYRFEDDDWRPATIERGRAVYIWDAAPRHALTLHYYDGLTWCDSVLQTRDVVLNAAGRIIAEPDIGRNDQAAPYCFRDIHGVLELKGGHPQRWVDEGAKSVLERIRSTKTDLAFLRGNIDPEEVDPLIYQAEFHKVHQMLSEEYKNRMQSTTAPHVELLWEDCGTNERGSYEARVIVSNCETEVGADFLKRMIETLFGQVPGEVSYITATVCRDPTGLTIRTARLNPKYIRNGHVDVGRIRDDIVNELHKNTTLGAEAFVDCGNATYAIYSKWQYQRSADARYAWRLVITLGLHRTKSYEIGVTLRADIEAQKQYLSSSRWHRLAQFAIAELGVLPETIMYLKQAVDRDHPRPLHDTRQISKAMRICSQVESRLEQLVVKP